MKYYAVRQGRQPGIYESWTTCREQTQGYSGAVFKSFETLDAAQEYLRQAPDKVPVKEKLPCAYIDGSYSRKSGRYGYGGFIFTGTEYHIIQGAGDAADYLRYRNITGEVRGAIEVMRQAVQLGIAELSLYYDYAGIEKWATGEWTCKTALSRYYRDYYQRRRDLLAVHFIAVKGHTGVEGNELADLLAKEAAGAGLRKKDVETLRAFRDRAGQPPGCE